MEIDKIRLSDIKKAEYNPRVISEDNYQKLKNSVKNFGLVEPILINLKNHTIISGHQRYDVLTDMELADDNLFEQEYQLIKYGDYGLLLTEEEPILPNEDYEKALNITLNNTNLTGDYDFEKLGALLEELEVSGLDISVTGFDGIDEYNLNAENYLDFNDFDLDNEYQNLLDKLEFDDGSNDVDFSETAENEETYITDDFEVVLVFDSEEQMCDAFDDLVEKGYNCRMSNS